MSRRTPIKELIEEEATAPASPRRRSTRIASSQKTAVSEEATVRRSKRTSLSHDDLSSNVSSPSRSSLRSFGTRSVSKSPTSLVDVPARRTRRSASTSSLISEENAARVASPAPRTSTRRKSISDSEVGTPRKSSRIKTESNNSTSTATSTPSKPKGRRASVTEGITPLEAIEELESKVEDENAIETEDAVLEPDSKKNENLPFKKKVMMMKKLQTIDEKDNDKGNTSSVGEDAEASKELTTKKEETPKKTETKMGRLSLKSRHETDDEDEDSGLDLKKNDESVDDEPLSEKKEMKTNSKPIGHSLTKYSSRRSADELQEEKELKCVLHESTKDKQQPKQITSNTAEQKMNSLEAKEKQDSDKDSHENSILEQSLQFNLDSDEGGDKTDVHSNKNNSDLNTSLTILHVSGSSSSSDKENKRELKVDITKSTAIEKILENVLDVQEHIVENKCSPKLENRNQKKRLSENNSQNLDDSLKQKDAAEEKSIIDEESFCEPMEVEYMSFTEISGPESTKELSKKDSIDISEIESPVNEQKLNIKDDAIKSPSNVSTDNVLKLNVSHEVVNAESLKPVPLTPEQGKPVSPRRRSARLLNQSQDNIQTETDKNSISTPERKAETEVEKASTELVEESIKSKKSKTPIKESSAVELLLLLQECIEDADVTKKSTSMTENNEPEISDINSVTKQNDTSADKDHEETVEQRVEKLEEDKGAPEINKDVSHPKQRTSGSPKLKSGNDTQEEQPHESSKSENEILNQSDFVSSKTDLKEELNTRTPIQFKDKRPIPLSDSKLQKKATSPKKSLLFEIKSDDNLDNEIKSLISPKKEDKSVIKGKEPVNSSLTDANSKDSENEHAQANHEKPKSDVDKILKSNNSPSKPTDNGVNSTSIFVKPTTPSAKGKDSEDDLQAERQKPKSNKNNATPSKLKEKERNSNLKASVKPTTSTEKDSDSEDSDLDFKIEKLIEDIEDDSSDSSAESVTHYLDNMAEECEEDTPSEGSNDIIEEGESIGSIDSEIDSDESYELDSFIDDDEDCNVLLSGEEYDLGQESKKTSKNRKGKWKRLQVSTSDDSADDEEIPQLVDPAEAKKIESKSKATVNGTEEDSDIDKMSTQPFCGLTPPSVLSIRDSLSDSDKLTDTKSDTNSIVINKEDNLKSLEEIKEQSSINLEEDKIEEGNDNLNKTPSLKFRSNTTKSSLVRIITPDPLKICTINTPNNSIIEEKSPGLSEKQRKRLSSLTIQENISLKDIEQGNVSDRIANVINIFCSSVKDESKDSPGNISLNVSLEYIKSPLREDAKEDTIYDLQNVSLQSEKIVHDKKLSESSDKEQLPSSNQKESDEITPELPRQKKKKHKKSKQVTNNSEVLNSEEVLESEVQEINNEQLKKKKKKHKKQKDDSNILLLTGIENVFTSDTQMEKFIKNTNESILSDDLDELMKGTKKISKTKDTRKAKVEMLPQLDDDSSEIKKKIKKRKKLGQDNIEELKVSIPVEDENTSNKKFKKSKLKSELKLGGDSEIQLDVFEEPSVLKMKKSKIVTEELEISHLKKKNRKRKHPEILPSKSSNIDYLPPNTIQQLVQGEKIKPSTGGTEIVRNRKPKLVPTKTMVNLEWESDIINSPLKVTASKKPKLEPLQFSKKDFKNKMLYDPNRVKRMDSKSLLKKKEKTKF